MLSTTSSSFSAPPPRRQNSAQKDAKVIDDQNGGNDKFPPPPSQSRSISGTPLLRLPKRAISEFSVQSDMDSSTMSARSTSVSSKRPVMRTVSSLFKKKKKNKNEGNAETLTVEDGPQNETQVRLDDSQQSTGITTEQTQQLEEQAERDRTLIESLETVLKGLDLAREKMERTEEAAQRAFNVWFAANMVVILVAVSVTIIQPLGEDSVWLLVGFATIAAIIHFCVEHQPKTELVLAEKDLEEAQRALKYVVRVLKREEEGTEKLASYGSSSSETVGSTTARTTNLDAVPLRAAYSDGGPQPFEPGFDLSGYRLNCFANLSNLDFEKQVLLALPVDKQSIFLEYERQFCDQFESKSVEPYNVPDRFTLLRFLQADKYEIEKAISRMNRTIQWRRENQCDAFLEDPDWRLIRRGWALRPRIFCGYDKNQRPLIAEKLGEFFGSEEAFRGITFAEWIKVYTFEQGRTTYRFREAVKTYGASYNHRMSFIGDLAGLRMLPALRLIPFLKMLVKEVETFWPEFAGDVALVNAPPIVSKLFSVVKKFLDPTVAEKIIIISGDCSAELIRRFGADSLPVEYGGKNPIKVPSCPKKLNQEFENKFPYTPVGV